MIFSVSRLKKYENCPGSFYRKYVLGKKELPTEPGEFGKAVHAAIAYILRDGMEKEAAVQKAVNEAMLPVDAEEVNKLIIPEVLNLREKIDSGNVERHFQIPLSSEEGAPVIQGYKDLELHDAVVIDWKSGWKTYHPLDDPQLGIYAWELHQRTGKHEIYGQLVFLRFPQKDFSHKYTLEDMEKARKWALDLANEISAKEVALAFGEDIPENLFPDTPGSGCQYCGFASECYAKSEQTNTAVKTQSEPENQQIEPGSIPTSAAEAEALAAEILRLENVLKTMKDDLKKYVKEYGPIQIDDHEFGFKPSVSWVFKPDDLKIAAQQMMEDGINPWEILTLGAKQLEKLRKKDPSWDEDKLSQFAKKKVTQSFRKYKAEGSGENAQDGIAS